MPAQGAKLAKVNGTWHLDAFGQTAPKNGDSACQSSEGAKSADLDTFTACDTYLYGHDQKKS